MAIEITSPVTPQTSFNLALAAAGRLVTALSAPPSDCAVKADYQGGHFLDLHFYGSPVAVAEVAELLGVEVETSPHPDTKGVMSKVLTSATGVTNSGVRVRAWVLMDVETSAVAA